MKEITKEDIERATQRYAEALTNDMVARNKVIKNQIEQRKTHNEVVLAFQDLQNLRFMN